MALTLAVVNALQKQEFRESMEGQMLHGRGESGKDLCGARFYAREAAGPRTD